MAKRINELTLPQHAEIDVQAFSRALNNTTTAYKFLWLLAILKIIESKNAHAKSQNSLVITFRDISREMIDLAVIPIYKFKLKFGDNDQIKGNDQTQEYLNSIFQYNSPKNSNNVVTSDSFSEAEFKKARTEMEKYVPYRLLAPFFESNLNGLKDHPKNKKIIKLAEETFHSKSKSPPPYRFINDDDNWAIEIHPLWRNYWLDNMAIIRGWTMWNWVIFLQYWNPSIPGIINKIQSLSELLVGDQRKFWWKVTKQENEHTTFICKGLKTSFTQMNAQRKFWREIIERKNGHTTCIYSGKEISFAECDIDHYIPWSFIGHNHLWNLVPVAKKVNRSKSDCLPSNDYLRALVDAQHEALTIHQEKFPKQYKRLVEAYSDLKLSKSELMDKEKLFAAYERLMNPTIAIAQNNQFSPGWRWKNK